MDFESVMEAVNSNVFAVWFLIGAALVFWMQAGFAMCECGFTRAKNSGNIIMKNLMDFCIGTVVFIFLGAGLLLGEDLVGFIGKPGIDILTDFANYDYSAFVFNLVFCATTATIVSGAMAERTKFLSYCVYSAIISAVVYPIEAHWIWGGGWLAQIGFHDYAGSCAIHMVGGIAALVGAAILGPLIGKFKKDADGKIVGVNAFPAHNIPIAALGVFILWLGWYGFNGAAAQNVEELGSIFLTTTVAPAVATVVCMIFTWIKFGKPDVSMCLNASLAGLVAITAPCDVTDCTGAFIIGVVAGLLVVFGVWLMDYKFHIDDPVGAIAVHMMNGIWGTLAVGLFATDTAPGFANAGILEGVFYGGGFKQLGLQIVGFVAVAVWSAVLMTIIFLGIKKTIGLRCSAEEEIMGLDSQEHGLPSAYADFVPSVHSSYDEAVVAVTGTVPVAEAVEVTPMVSFEEPTAPDGTKITKIEIICKERMLEPLKDAMLTIGITGMTVSHVMGCGAQKGKPEYYRGVAIEPSLLPKIQVDIVVAKVPVRSVIEMAKKVLYTGHIGDGKIFVYNVENAVKVRTGEEGYNALQDTDVNR